MSTVKKTAAAMVAEDEGANRKPGAPMISSGVSQDFLDHLAARDFDRLAATLAPAAQARLLLPHGLEVRSGREDISRRIASWFAVAAKFQVLSVQHDRVGSRHSASWRFRVGESGRSWEVVEQFAFFDEGPDGIERLDLMCSGFLPEAATPASEALPAGHVFDAGTMGCADGLAQEFRRRLADVPVGDSFCVVVRDPAAKEDLPALARMLGQSITSIEAHDDGRLTINVERCK